MTRQQLKNRLPYIIVWANGEEIECKLPNIGWSDVTDGSTFFDENFQHRIKPKEEPKAKKHYTLPLSEIDALEITRDMWQWLSEDAERSKYQWISQFHPELAGHMLADCACCAYAKQKTGQLDCERCPLRRLWGSNRFACNQSQEEGKTEGEFYIWRDPRRPDSERLAAAKCISEAAAQRIAELTTATKKQPILRPWKPEEVPVGALLRADNMLPTQILSVYIDGRMQRPCVTFIRYSQYLDEHKVEHAFCADLLTNIYHHEHSLDHGKTWLLCGVAID